MQARGGVTKAPGKGPHPSAPGALPPSQPGEGFWRTSAGGVLKSTVEVLKSTVEVLRSAVEVLKSAGGAGREGRT